MDDVDYQIHTGMVVQTAEHLGFFYFTFQIGIE